MLIGNKILSKEKWIQRFNQKFKSFCDKLPFYCEFNLIDNIVLMTIIKNGSEQLCEFTLDLTINPKYAISEIKQKLIKDNYYPNFRLEMEFKEKYSAKEIKEMLDNGIELEEAMSFTKIIKRRTTYRVEKIHNLENNVSLRNLQTNRITLYKMKVPVIKFLEILDKDVEEAQKFFFENSFETGL